MPDRIPTKRLKVHEGREWFEQKVAELVADLESLPPDRQRQFARELADQPETDETETETPKCP